MLDPGDDQACLHQLAALHDLAAGRLVCHPTPGATAPVLIRDVLEALGKRRDALARATATGTAVWLVWHDTDPPSAGWAGEVWSWPRAVAALRAQPSPDRSRLRAVDAIYREAVAEARREARLWRVAPPRQRHGSATLPSPGAGSVRCCSASPSTPPARSTWRCVWPPHVPGSPPRDWPSSFPPSRPRWPRWPRITPPVMDQLRRIACPTSAAALLLAVVTDARAGRVADCRPGWIRPDAGQVTLLPGTYHIPEVARPLLRAALLDHQIRGLPAYTLLTHRDGGLLLAQAMGHRIARAAAIADVPLPHAASPAGCSDSGPETPFAAPLVNGGARIDGAGPPPQLRPHRPPRH